MSEPEKEKPDQTGEVTRRDFFNEISLAALGIAGAGAAVVTYNFLSPNVLFEQSMVFRAGNPDLYPVDTVTPLPDQQVYIVRTAAGFYALSTVCTHLGCITQWKPEANLIACPCHGSKFNSGLPPSKALPGTKIEGPAPLPLPHFAMTMTADGELQVDKSQKSDQVLKV